MLATIDPNRVLVASFSPDEPVRNVDYKSELELIEQDRHHRELRSLMNNRYARL